MQAGAEGPEHALGLSHEEAVPGLECLRLGCLELAITARLSRGKLRASLVLPPPPGDENCDDRQPDAGNLKKGSGRDLYAVTSESRDLVCRGHGV